MIARVIDRPHAPSFCTQNGSLNLIIIFEAGAAAAESGAKISPVAQILQPD